MDEIKKATVEGEDFGGTWVQLGGQRYKLAPLNFKALRGGLAEKIGKLEEMRSGVLPTTEQFGFICDIVDASLRRNYPSLPEGYVDDRLDLSNFNPVIAAVLSATALPVKEGDPESGETAP